MIKRNIDDVLDAIARAHAETRGRTLDQIDHRGDAQAAWARKLITITLEDYWGDLAHEVPAATWRYRKEMERALGGALGMVQAFRAFSMARESEPEELTETERRLADEWVAAMPRAHAAGVDGLGPVPGAWFDVRSVRQDPPTAPQPLKPVQINLW